MVSLLRYFLCLITVIPSPTVAAEAAWGGWHGGAVTAPYYGCVYGYPYCAGTATVIRLTGRYDYAPNYGYRYPYAHSPMFAATSTLPFAVFGVWKPIGL